MTARVFQLFVRRFKDVGYSAHVLGRPHLASFGEKMTDVYDDLSTVCTRLIERGELHDDGTPETWSQRRVELDVRAMQRGRLLTVPMRFTVLLATAAGKRREKVAGPTRVLVPRLNVEHTLHDLADFDAFIEEVIRHELHLAPLDRLLDVAWTGEESLRSLTVDAKFDARAHTRKVALAAPKVTRAPLPPGLSEACRRLGDERDAGTVERAFERTAEVDQLAGTLMSASVLLQGPSMVGKTALVHELVHRVAEAKPTSRLHGLEVYSTSGSRIVAGMRYLGEWQDRVKRMVASLRARNAVLHLDSLSELLSTGVGRGDSGMDIAQQLLPAIQAGDIRVVLEATADDVARAERTHGAFLRALRTQVVAPLPPTQARAALSAAARRVGKQRRVEVVASALDRASDLVDRFADAGGMPGAAIDLLRAAARPAPGASAKVNVVDAEAVMAAFLARTGYPRELIDPAITLDAEKVLERLRHRVVGQDEATLLLRNLIVTLKTGLSDPSRPLGTYLLLGPTGVGKTESALSLCSYLFGDEKRLTRFDMAEYAAPGSAWRLVATGSAAGGSLTARVREQPFGVVLLDEIEKADSGVHDLLLQLLGEGRLTDSSGRTVSFRNTVVLLTSNLGAEQSGKTFGFGDVAGDARTHYLAAASQFFRPELVNRLDQVVAYQPLSPQHIRQIAARVLEQALGREGLTRRGLKVTYGDEVIARVAELGFDARYGARPLKRAVEQHVMAPLAQWVASLGEADAAHLELFVDERGAIQRRTK